MRAVLAVYNSPGGAASKYSGRSRRRILQWERLPAQGAGTARQRGSAPRRPAWDPPTGLTDVRLAARLPSGVQRHSCGALTHREPIWAPAVRSCGMLAPWGLSENGVGRWVAQDGKTVILEAGCDILLVTVSPAVDASPYRSAELLGGGTKLIDRLPARVGVDTDGVRHIEIEAGTPEVGPTYRLYPALPAESGGYRPAEDDAEPTKLILLPNRSTGLYDEWEDDLGIPWALPLEPLHWSTAAA